MRLANVYVELVGRMLFLGARCNLARTTCKSYFFNISDSIRTKPKRIKLLSLVGVDLILQRWLYEKRSSAGATRQFQARFDELSDLSSFRRASAFFHLQYPTRAQLSG